MSDVIHIVSGACLLFGGFFVLVGGIGLLRMPDFYTRMHAGSVTETLGTMLIILALLTVCMGSTFWAGSVAASRKHNLWLRGVLLIEPSLKH